MTKQIPTRMWSAKVELEIQNVALAVGYDEVKKGNMTQRIFTAPWLKNGTIYWDIGNRLRGWLKEQISTIKPSAKDAVQYGVKSRSLPQVGEIAIGKKEDIIGDPNFPESKKDTHVSPDGLPYPYEDIIKTKEQGRATSRFSYYYVLNKPFTVKAELFCFARNIAPEAVRELLEKLGPYAGIGDRHSDGRYGLFKLKKFECKTEILSF